MAELYTQNPGVGTQNQQLLDTQRLAQGMRGSAATVPEAQQQLAQAEAANTMAQLSAPSVFSEARRQYGTDAQIPQSAQAAGNLADMFRMYVADVNAARAGTAPSQGFTPAPPPGFEGARMPTEYRPMLTEQTLASPAQGFYNPAESARYFGSALGQYRDISSALAGITGFNREELARQLQGTERSISAILGATSAQEERARRQLETILDVEARAREQQIAQQNAKAAFLNAVSTAVESGSLDREQAQGVLSSLGLIQQIPAGAPITMPETTQVITGDAEKDRKILAREAALKEYKKYAPGSGGARRIQDSYERQFNTKLNPTEKDAGVENDVAILRKIKEAESILQEKDVKSILSSTVMRNAQWALVTSQGAQKANDGIRRLYAKLNEIKAEQVQAGLGEYTSPSATAYSSSTPTIQDSPQTIKSLLNQIKGTAVSRTNDVAQNYGYRSATETTWIPLNVREYFKEEKKSLGVEDALQTLGVPTATTSTELTPTGSVRTPEATAAYERLRQRALDAFRKGQ